MGNYEDVVTWESRALDAEAGRRIYDAQEAHGQALQAASPLGRPLLLAVLWNRLGNVLMAENRIQRAVTAYEAGLEALQGEPQSDLDMVLSSIRGITKGYDPRASTVDVPDLYTETTAPDLDQAEADPALAVKLLINIGNAYLLQPQDRPALNAYKQALRRPEIAVAPALYAHALTHLAILWRRRGHADQAATTLRRALDLMEAHGDRLEARRALTALAGIDRDRGQIDRALETYRQALDLYRQTDDPLGEGRALAGLGDIYLARSQIDAAQAALQRAVDRAQQANDQDTLWHAYWGLGRCLHAAGKLDAAVEAFQLGLEKIEAHRSDLNTDEGRVTFLESVHGIFDDLIAVHLDRAQADPAAYVDALRVVEQARGQALYDLMGIRRRRLGSRQSGVRDARRGAPGGYGEKAPGVPLPAGIANMAVQSAPGFDLVQALGDPVWTDDVPMWGRHSAAAADGGQAESAAAAFTPTPLTRLVFHALAERTAVLVVGRDGSVQGHVAALSQAALAERVTAVRQALRVDDAPRGIEMTRDARRQPTVEVQADYEPLLRGLYDNLIAPLAGVLPADGTPLVVEPHGALWLLPFAALLAPDGTWLADRWPLLYAPSAQVLDEIRSEPDYGGPKDLKPLIVGNPAMPALPEQDGLAMTLRPLPGAEEECRAVSGLFSGSEGTLLIGEAADWASVTTQMPRHGIVHLATHGIAYAERPLSSFVALGAIDEPTVDKLTAYESPVGWPQSTFMRGFARTQGQVGMLTAEQILYLPLPADLVTLSACQTGLGQVSGEGIIGLSRSFLVAGARAVLVSLWSVSDAATAELMTAFYQGYIELDHKAVALQRAMQELRKKQEYAHPRFWAPFVVVGAEA